MAEQRIYEFNPTVLAERYWEEGLSLEALGKEYGCSGNTILKRMKEYGIPRRPQGYHIFELNRRNNHKTCGWSKKYDKCQGPGCGTTERPHKARGFCEHCYDRLVRKPRTTNRRWGVYTTRRRRKKEKPEPEIMIVSQQTLKYCCAKCGYRHYEEVKWRGV